MSNYVQEMWQQNTSYASKPRGTRIAAWVIGACVAAAIAAIATESLWYPYLSTYF